MRSIIKLLIIIIFTISVSIESYSEVRYHCPQDSVAVLSLLESASQGDNLGRRTLAASKWFIGRQGASVADNDSVGTIMIRLDSVDRRSFIDMSLAAALASIKTGADLRDFEKALESVSRRKGKDEGFASQFLYNSDWVVDNVYRGNLKELTEYVESGNFRTKTLDYVSRHKDEFPAMADSTTAEKVRVIEMGYRSHRIPHLKKHFVGNKSIAEVMRDGDIIILLPHSSDFDVYDMGVVEMINGVPHLIHLSRMSNEVVADPYPLQRLFKLENQYFYGFRWLRPSE